LYKDDCTKIDTSSVIIDESIFGGEVYIATLVTWVIVYFCMFKGVNSSSYVVWVTVPLPVFFIFIMVVNNLTLPNASSGVAMYIRGLDMDGNKPDVGAILTNGQMWSEACGQIFFSLGICMGSMTSLASYNPIDKPIIGDAFKIAFTNSGISFFAGFAVFSVVGYLQGLGSPLANKTASIGLAFIAYPAAIETLPGSNGWSFILSITLFTLGIDSAFSLLEAASTVIQDSPNAKQVPRKLISLILCILGALGSIFFSFNWGFTYFDVVDHFLNVYLMLLLGIMECFGAGWIYELADITSRGRGPKLAANILIISYWLPLLVLGPVSIWILEGSSWVGFIIFWGIHIVGVIASWMASGEKWGSYFFGIYLWGVRKLSRSMTKLSKTKGSNKREWWEPIFEIWWGFSIKYFVPFALWFLIMFSLKADLDTPYGDYHSFWQIMGWLYPLAGFVAFLYPIFRPPSREDFPPEVDAAFKEDDFAGVGAESSYAAGTVADSKGIDDGKAVEMAVQEGAKQ